MKKPLLIVLVGLLLFFVSFAASYLAKSMMGKKDEVAAKPEVEEKKPAAEPAPAKAPATTAKKNADEPLPTPIVTVPTETSDKEIRVGFRPPYVEGSEESAQLASLLKSRLDAVRERESQLSFRQESVRLFEDDIKTQQKAIDEIKTQVDIAMKDVNDLLDKQMKQVDSVRGELEVQKKKLEDARTELKRDEVGNFKKMGALYDSMEPEAAAQIFIQLSKTGKVDTAVLLLGSMKERQASRVLAAISNADKDLAALFTEKLRGIKLPGTPNKNENTPGNTRPTASPTSSASL